MHVYATGTQLKIFGFFDSTYIWGVLQNFFISVFAAALVAAIFIVEGALFHNLAQSMPILSPIMGLMGSMDRL